MNQILIVLPVNVLSITLLLVLRRVRLLPRDKKNKARPRSLHLVKSLFLVRNLLHQIRPKAFQRLLQADNSIRDFNQTNNLPKPTRRTLTIYGSSRPVRRLTRNARNNPSGFNILPDPKSPLLIKPSCLNIASSATTRIANGKKALQTSNKTKVIQRRHLQKFEASGPGTSVPAVSPPQKRSRSISSVNDRATPPAKKPVLQSPVDTQDVSPYYMTEDLQEVFSYYATNPGTPIPQGAQDEKRYILNRSYPVYIRKNSFDDKENVPPHITYSPVRENYNVYN